MVTKHKKYPDIFKRPGSPFYWAKVMVKGKRLYHKCGTDAELSQKEAAEWKAKQKGQSSSSSWDKAKADFFEFCKANKKPGTITKFDIAIRYFEQVFSPNSCDDINETVLQKYMDYLKSTLPQQQKEQGKKHILGPVGANRYFRAFTKFLNECVKAKNMKQRLDYSLIERAQEIEKEVEYFSLQELELLIQRAPQSWRPVILLGARAGLRPQEIRELLWTDIDFENDIIEIQNHYAKGKITEFIPKKCHCRTVPLDPILKDFLLTLQRKGPYVVYNEYGERFTSSGMSSYFGRKLVKTVNRLNEQANKKADKIKGSPKKLRATFASLAIQNDADIYAVSKTLGHKSIKTTEKHYAAVMAETLKKRAIAKLPAIKIRTKRV